MVSPCQVLSLPDGTQKDSQALVHAHLILRTCPYRLLITPTVPSGLPHVLGHALPEAGACPVLCCPLLPSVFPTIRVFSKESVLGIRWPKYWSFSFSISPSNEYSGLISFRMDWLDLLAVQGTLRSLLQHHSSEAPILRRSAFFISSSHIQAVCCPLTIAFCIWCEVGYCFVLFHMNM